MQALTALLRSKVGIAIVGVILIGGIGAYIGAASILHPDGLTGGYFANNDPTAPAASVAGTVTSSSSDGAGDHTATPLPTDTPANAPTDVPTTPPTGSGQTVDLHGSIGNINTAANSFILNVNGTSRTVVVNGQTSFQGASSTLQGLRTGWQAEVKGRAQSDGTFLAFLVNSDNGA
ncbi:MAG TPA: DUF5666 domain-containing protein [Ktedonobacterales bacterium]|nr:DUF5666 domain-containing protein [Ktedonobacterales bacterium]